MEQIVHSYVLKDKVTGSFFHFIDEDDGVYRFINFPSNCMWKWDSLDEIKQFLKEHPKLQHLAICDYTVTVSIGEPI